MLKEDSKRMLAACIYPVLILVGMWTIFCVDNLFDLQLWHWGVVPRTVNGLPGILLHPFIHANLKHILSNSLPFFITGWFIMYFYRAIALRVFFIIYVGTGTLMWLCARPVVHIGASGIVYGLITFIFFSGLLRKNKNLLAITFLMVLLYGGLAWYALPWAAALGISWEGHLCGALMGFLCAVFYRHRGPLDDRHPDDFNEADETPPDWWVKAHELNVTIRYHYKEPEAGQSQPPEN